MNKLTAREYLDIFNSKDIKKSSAHLVEGLSKSHAEKYLLELSAYSMNITPTAYHDCECGKELSSTITHIHVNEGNNLFFDLGDVKLQMKYPRLDISDDPLEQFLNCIYFVVLHDLKIKWSDATVEDMEEISDYLTLELIQDALDKLNAEIYSVVEFKCDCGKIHQEIVTGFDNLIKFYKD